MQVNVVVFDKTGTLTEGRMRLLRALPLGSATKDDLLCFAAAAEAQTRHPLAEATLRYVDAANLWSFPV